MAIPLFFKYQPQIPVQIYSCISCIPPNAVINYSVDGSFLSIDGQLSTSADKRRLSFLYTCSEPGLPLPTGPSPIPNFVLAKKFFSLIPTSKEIIFRLVVTNFLDISSPEVTLKLSNLFPSSKLDVYCGNDVKVFRTSPAYLKCIVEYQNIGSDSMFFDYSTFLSYDWNQILEDSTDKNLDIKDSQGKSTKSLYLPPNFIPSTVPSGSKFTFEFSVQNKMDQSFVKQNVTFTVFDKSMQPKFLLHSIFFLQISAFFTKFF